MNEETGKKRGKDGKGDREKKVTLTDKGTESETMIEKRGKEMERGRERWRKKRYP